MTYRLPPGRHPNLRTTERPGQKLYPTYPGGWVDFEFVIELGDGGIRLTAYVRDVPRGSQVVIVEEEWGSVELRACR